MRLNIVIRLASIPIKNRYNEFTSSFYRIYPCLVGQRRIRKVICRFGPGPPCQHPAESIVPHRCQFPQFSHLPSLISRLPCALVSGGVLSRPASDVYVRPSFPCRLLLCAGSFVDVRWTSVEAVCFRRTGGDARSLCRSRWKIDSCL